jgi:hypothetical protein
VFVPVKLFQPNLIQVLHSRVGSGLAHGHKTRLDWLDRGEHSTLL